MQNAQRRFTSCAHIPSSHTHRNTLPENPPESCNQTHKPTNPKPQTLPTWPHGTNLREPAGHDVGQIRAGGGWRGRRIVLSDQRRCVPRHLPFHCHSPTTPTPTLPPPPPLLSNLSLSLALKPLSNLTILAPRRGRSLADGLSSAPGFACFIWLRARGEVRRGEEGADGCPLMQSLS